MSRLSAICRHIRYLSGDIRQEVRGSPQGKGLTDNEHLIRRDGQDGQIRALEVMAVASADRRRGCGYSGDPGIRDHAVQGADRGGRGMVLPAAPLVADFDGDSDCRVSRAVREALARGAMVEP